MRIETRSVAGERRLSQPSVRKKDASMARYRVCRLEGGTGMLIPRF